MRSAKLGYRSVRAFTFVLAFSIALIATYIGCGLDDRPHGGGLGPLVTQATPTATVGQPISDTATLSGQIVPTGTITFTLFGPNDATCAGTPVSTSTVPVLGNGDYSSAPFTPTQAGNYRWIAAYSGDRFNVPLITACNDANEVSAVSVAPTTLVTRATDSVAFGQAISDTATLSGGIAPTGTITFNLFGPADTTCASTPVFTSTVAVSGNGTYPSGPFTPTQPGTYRWTAAYSGDANNAVSTSACNDANEVTTINQATPTLTTQATESATVGQPISDTAFLSGGINPTGVIGFNLYEPFDVNCANSPFSTSVPISGNGAYPSGPFTPTQAGTYRWTAAYSGDANNAAAMTACNDPNEVTTVTRAQPTLTTQATQSALVNQTISDTATLRGFDPTGTITFFLFGPDDATCSGFPASSVIGVNGDGDYSSAAFTVTQAGTYRWTATYSGDTNNFAAASACNDANETTTVQNAVCLSPGDTCTNNTQCCSGFCVSGTCGVG